MFGSQITITGIRFVNTYGPNDEIRDLRPLAFHCRIDACLTSLRNDRIGRAMVSTGGLQILDLEHPVLVVHSEPAGISDCCRAFAGHPAAFETL